MLEVLFHFISNLGYIGFFIYMVLVGTFIPLPTQLILIPIGILVSEGNINLIYISLVTTVGTTTGALINYFLSKKISKKFISQNKLLQIKVFFNKYGKLSIILAPLSFGMGQYISIPAGMAQMNLKWFIPLIFISNLIWNLSMIMLGYLYGKDNENSTSFLFFASGIIVIIIVVTIITYKEINSKK